MAMKLEYHRTGVTGQISQAGELAIVVAKSLEQNQLNINKFLQEYHQWYSKVEVDDVTDSMNKFLENLN